MSILLDEGQQAIATESKRVVDARANQSMALQLLEERGQFDQGYWDMCREQGWTAIALPDAVGGLDLGLIELGQVALAIGGAGAGAPFLTSSYGVSDIILRHGNAQTKDAWLARLASGDAIGTIAFSEGANPLPSTSSVHFADGKLNGTKKGVTAGLHADVAIVWAQDNGEPVLVVADLAGIEAKPVDTFDNSRVAADLIFADTPAVRLDVGNPRQAALEALARMAIVTAWEQVGGAEAMMFIARDYANTRKAFGQLIGAFQSVKHRIAELYGLVEIARANALHAAANAEGPALIKLAAAARLSATEAYDTAARDCVQVHGGIGVTWESGLHLHLRRTRTLALELGNSLFWEDVLVDQLTGDAA